MHLSRCCSTYKTSDSFTEAPCPSFRWAFASCCSSLNHPLDAQRLCHMPNPLRAWTFGYAAAAHSRHGRSKGVDLRGIGMEPKRAVSRQGDAALAVNQLRDANMFRQTHHMHLYTSLSVCLSMSVCLRACMYVCMHACMYGGYTVSFVCCQSCVATSVASQLVLLLLILRRIPGYTMMKTRMLMMMAMTPVLVIALSVAVGCTEDPWSEHVSRSWARQPHVLATDARVVTRHLYSQLTQKLCSKRTCMT